MRESTAADQAYEQFLMEVMARVDREPTIHEGLLNRARTECPPAFREQLEIDILGIELLVRVRTLR